MMNKVVKMYERILLEDNTNAKDAYLHALKVVRGRYPEGEDVIAQDAEYAFDYAVNVLKGRFEKGEEIISQYGDLSYQYADLIKGRFEKGEEAIEREHMAKPYYDNILQHIDLADEEIDSLYGALKQIYINHKKK